MRNGVVSIPSDPDMRRARRDPRLDALLVEETRLRRQDAMSAQAMQRRPVAGDAVRWAGPSACLIPGCRLRWVVQACACPVCMRGSHVAVDQTSEHGTYEGWRHIAAAHVIVDDEIGQTSAGRWADHVAMAGSGVAPESRASAEGVAAEYLYALAMTHVGAEKTQ